MCLVYLPIPSPLSSFTAGDCSRTNLEKLEPRDTHALLVNNNGIFGAHWLTCTLDVLVTREMWRILRRVGASFHPAPMPRSTSSRWGRGVGRPKQWLTCACAADIISTVEFDHTGNYLATGDKGGRVVLFERNETVYSL